MRQKLNLKRITKTSLKQLSQFVKDYKIGDVVTNFGEYLVILGYYVNEIGNIRVLLESFSQKVTQEIYNKKNESCYPYIKEKSLDTMLYVYNSSVVSHVEIIQDDERTRETEELLNYMRIATELKIGDVIETEDGRQDLILGIKEENREYDFLKVWVYSTRYYKNVKDILNELVDPTRDVRIHIMELAINQDYGVEVGKIIGKVDKENLERILLKLRLLGKLKGYEF